VRGEGARDAQMRAGNIGHAWAASIGGLSGMRMR